MKIYLLLALLISSVSMPCYAQQAKLDSLIAVAKNNPKEDSLKVLQLQAIVRQYGKMKMFTEADRVSEQAFTLAKKINNAKLMVDVADRQGRTYHGWAMYMPALKYYNKAVEVGIAVHEKKGLAGVYLDMGALYMAIPDYPKSLEAHQHALDLYNELHDEDGASTCYVNIGVIYSQIGELDQAIIYTSKALAFFRKTLGELDYGVAVSYSGLASNFLWATDEQLKKAGVDPAQRRTLALDYLNKALYATQHGGEFTATHEGAVYRLLGQYYESGNDGPAALDNYLRAEKISRKAEMAEDLVETLSKLGYFYGQHNEPEKGKAYLKEVISMCRNLGKLDVEETANEQLSALYEKEGKADSALFYFKRHMVINDQLITEAKEKDIARRQLQFDFSVKENDFKLVQAATDYKLKQQVLLAEKKQQELLVQQQQLQLIKKEKDLERLAYLQQQEKLQNEKNVTELQMEKNLVQTKFEKAENDKKLISRDKQLVVEKETKVYLIIGLGILLGIAGFIFYNQRKTAKLNKIISVQKQSLEHLSEVKDKIFSVVSHDMRAPVNSLISFIDLLENGTLKQEKLAMYAGELKTNLTHTSSLMNNLLLWASSQMKGFRSNAENLDLREVTENMLEGIRHHQQNKNVNILNNIPEGIIAKGDRNMLSVILRNITGNAIKFSFSGGNISIGAERTGDTVSITIKDEGTGMSTEAVNAFNGDDTVMTESKRGTDNEKGTGLGLLLCKTFAEQMNGKIIARNDQPGMSFILSLPA